MTAITPQRLPCSPVYSAVGIQDYVSWKPTMFLHYFNDSDVNVGIVISSVSPDTNGSYHSYAVSIPANDETIVGPFDGVRYSPVVSITCEYFEGVTVAALYTGYVYLIETAELTTVNGVCSTTPIILAGILPSATVEQGG